MCHFYLSEFGAGSKFSAANGPCVSSAMLAQHEELPFMTPRGGWVSGGKRSRCLGTVVGVMGREKQVRCFLDFTSKPNQAPKVNCWRQSERSACDRTARAPEDLPEETFMKNDTQECFSAIVRRAISVVGVGIHPLRAFIKFLLSLIF